MPPSAKDSGESAQERKDLSNFITQLKNSTDPNKMQVYTMYQGMSRFDSQKKEIIRKWKMDKSCKWVNSMEQQISATTEAKSTTLEGWGTK